MIACIERNARLDQSRSRAALRWSRAAGSEMTRQSRGDAIPLSRGSRGHEPANEQEVESTFATFRRGWAAAPQPCDRVAMNALAGGSVVRLGRLPTPGH